MEPKMTSKGPQKYRHFHIWWVLDAFFGFSMRTRHLPSLFYRFWHAFHQVFLKALRKTLARTSREPAKNLASTYVNAFVNAGSLAVPALVLLGAGARAGGTATQPYGHATTRPHGQTAPRAYGHMGARPHGH